ncbi:RidA family protein [Bremerella alba]|uniref:Putative reactive intermediate deaminase TdcF n=1 Tax=Bremerella alba TaxID=980252 RepID=A0A7V9A9E9_9BACT|nr:RidA family protein [Bremerella alba]MBA2117392.1 putative reactive intermediate deaminase TdcF [Bremerella alba]
MKTFHAIQDPSIPTSHLPFSPAVQFGSLIFVSGQASVDSSGKILTDSFEGEMRRSLENMQRILAAANLSLSDVVQTRNYVGSQEDLAEFNRIYREYFDEPYPARTTLMGCLGTLLKFEVDVIAVIPEHK